MVKGLTREEKFVKIKSVLEKNIITSQRAIDGFKKEVVETNNLGYVFGWRWQQAFTSEIIKREFKDALDIIDDAMETNSNLIKTIESLIKRIDEWFSRHGFRHNSTCPISNMNNVFEGQALIDIKETYTNLIKMIQ